MAVYLDECSELGDYHSVAERIAADRGESLVTESIDRAIEVAGDNPVLYVGHPHSLSEETLLRLQRRLSEDGPDDGSFSLITGRTPETAESLYRRTGEGRGDDCLLLLKSRRDWFTRDDDLTLLAGSDATVENLRKQLERGIQSLSIFTNSRPIHMYLSDGLLCGFPTDDVPYDGNQPFCVRDGEMDCPLEGELLHTDDVDVNHVFLPSCTPAIPNQPTGFPVHVATGFLENATSLIGVYRPMDIDPLESFLHRGLLRAGYTTVERTYLLNRSVNTTSVRENPYVCFGHPDRSLAAPDEKNWKTDVDSHPDGYDLSIEDIDAPIVDITLPASGFNRDVYVRNVTEQLADAEFYYAGFREKDGVRILLYSLGNLEADQIQLEVTSRPVVADTRSRLVRSVENARSLDQVNLLDTKAAGQLKNLVNQLDGLVVDCEQERFDANVHWDIRNRVENLSNNVDTLQGRLMDLLSQSRAHILIQEYADSVQHVAVDASGARCAYCERPVEIRTVADVRRSMKRELGTCPQCGYLFDVPSFDNESMSYPRIRGLEDGDILRVAEETDKVTVEFENTQQVPMKAMLFPRIEVQPGEKESLSWKIFSPEYETVELSPGESASATFDIDPDPIQRNKYSIFGYVVGNGAIYRGSRQIIVGEHYGHIRIDKISDQDWDAR